MKYYIIMITLVLFIFLSCNNSNVYTDKSFIGKGIDYFKSWNDNLMYDTVFYISRSKSLYEYQGDLLRFYPELHNNDSLKVREVCFDKSKKKLYIWFKFKNGNWIAIDDVLVRKDVSF